MGIFSKAKENKEEVVKTEKTEAKAAVSEVPVAGGSQVLLYPHLSEKGAHFASTGKYVFMVVPSANKPEIKKSIQKIYSVHVEDVKIIKLPAKSRRYGKAKGETSAMKKAIVVLRKGEKIPGIIESVG